MNASALTLERDLTPEEIAALFELTAPVHRARSVEDFTSLINSSDQTVRAAERAQLPRIVAIDRQAIAQAQSAVQAVLQAVCFLQDEEEFARLAKLDSHSYQREREAAVTRLRMGRGALDKCVREARRRQHGSTSGNPFEHSNEDGYSRAGTRGTSSSNDAKPDSNTSEHLSADVLAQTARELLRHPDPLALVEAQIQSRGYAGEVAPAVLAYVSGSSRFQTRPLSLHYDAPSGSGKNYTVDAGLALLPPEAFYKISAGSQRALIYTSQSFENRIVVIEEADSIPAEGPAASAIRSIANDAEMSYEVVEQNPATGQFETRRIVKKGATGLVTTSDRPLDRQMTTRMLAVAIPDDPEQTQMIMLAEARQSNTDQTEDQPNLEKFWAYHRWLGLYGERRVSVPFAETLARMIQTRAVRARRDFKQLLTVIKTCAFLAQKHRARTVDGWVQATLVDYKRARDLLVRAFDTAVGEGVTPAVRATVEAVEQGRRFPKPTLLRA